MLRFLQSAGRGQVKSACARALSVGADPSVQGICEALSNSLPRTEFQMAYGSAVFRQAGYAADDKPMVDFLLAVEDPVDWHRQNLARNAHHYSFLKYFGAAAISSIQGTAAQVYFHPYVSIPVPASVDQSSDSGSAQPAVVKYGVMSVAALKQDLAQWNSLYAAGRLHKPVLISHDATSWPGGSPKGELSISELQQKNLTAALAAAILLLPPPVAPGGAGTSGSITVSALDLFCLAASVSYVGDPRLAVGAENPNKVYNIVAPHVPEFLNWYKHALAELWPIVHAAGDVDDVEDLIQTEESGETHVAFNIDRGSSAAIHTLLEKLPPPVLGALGGTNSAALQEDLHLKLRETLGRVVASSATPQTLKGLLSAGPARSVEYALQKLAKGILKSK
eukprot:INCI4777.1.p1 GENE.INCI4777.1~~INCI4777.1.p1  ORF type:complete len:393 (-),score=56.24 INCI4777.1:795-1973(-)